MNLYIPAPEREALKMGHTIQNCDFLENRYITSAFVRPYR